VLTLAQDEALRFCHNYIGTEHILLGLVAEGEGVAAKVLGSLGVELENVRKAVELVIGRGERQVVGEIGLTPRAEKVIELARDEGRRLGHDYVGTEHILLGLIREGEGVAAGVLESLGVKLEKVRGEVINVLTNTASSSPGRATLSPREAALAQPASAIASSLPRAWDYLAIPTTVRGGSVVVESFFTRNPLPYDLPGMRIHHVLDVLGDNGWELVAVDPRAGAEGGQGGLYIFKRPRSASPPDQAHQDVNPI
jgi:hypothetical protein